MGSHIMKFKAHATQIGGTVKPSLMRRGVVSPGFFFFVQRHPSQNLGAC